MKEKLRRHFCQMGMISDVEWEMAAKLLTHRSFRKHQYLVQIGNPVPCDFWVAKGLLKAYAVDPSGKESILQFASEDWWCTDYAAYQNQLPASLHIDCLEDSEVFCLKLEDRESLCRQSHAFEHFFRMKAHRGYIALQQRILSLLKDSVDVRYQNFLNLYPDLSQRLPKKWLAAYLGVSRETLSRLQN